ncbi:MAG: hypothetical protein VKJ27_10730, partial [Synechocystis sp.]|nr:hypothetical protein [Synechocystis sp.]
MSVIDFKDLKHYDRDVKHLSLYTQTYGVLIVLNQKRFTIDQISGNVEDWFQVSPQVLLNKPLGTLLPSATVQELGDRHRQATGNFYHRFQFQQTVDGQWKQFQGLLRRYQQYLVVEIEPGRGDSSGAAPHYHERLKTFVSQIRPETSFYGTAALIAAEVQAVVGFDRVLVYQFSAEEGDIVIAEALK